MTIRSSTSVPTSAKDSGRESTATMQRQQDHHILMVFPFSTTSGSDHDRAFQKIKHEFPGTEVTLFNSAGGQVPLESWQKATILVTLSNLPEKLEDVPNLQLLHLISAGSDHISSHWLMKDPEASKIIITTSSGIHGPPIAEWVIMTSLVLTKHYNQIHDWQKQHQWGGKAAWFNSSGDWVGRTVGILGYGSIGRQVARVFAAMGVNIHAYTNSPRDTAEAKKDDGYVIPHTGDPEGTIPQKWFSAKREGLDTFLKSGLHALVICTPLTPNTTNLLTTKEFEILQKHSPYPDQPTYFNSVKMEGDNGDTNVDANTNNTTSTTSTTTIVTTITSNNNTVDTSTTTTTTTTNDNDSNNNTKTDTELSPSPSPSSSSPPPPGAIILNISRGKILNQPNLISALKTHTILGAALDVTNPEPLPKDNELWDLPNVIITPHMSAIGSEYLGRSLDILRVNLGRLIGRDGDDGKLINVVERERGY